MTSEIERRVVNIIDAFRGRLDDHWLDMYKDLAQHNECVVALECLCVQLEEFDIVPTENEYAEICKIGATMKMKEHSWNFLKPKQS